MKHFIYTGILFTILACNQSQKQDQAQDTTVADTVQPSEPEIPLPDTTALMESPENELKSGELYRAYKEHVFSDEVKNDRFTITAKGTDLLEAKVKFTIENSTGRKIFEDSFDSKRLLDYGYRVGIKNPDTISDATKRRYIKSRLRGYFNEINFKTPAVSPDAMQDSHFTSKKIFDEVKGDPKSVAFFYLLDTEFGQQLFWSKKAKKVLVFYSCCKTED